MNISRKHAVIQFNFLTRRFELTVQGKNGVTVNDQLFVPGHLPRAMQSGDVIATGSCSFHFLLPADPPSLAAQNGLAALSATPPGATQTDTNGAQVSAAIYLLVRCNVPGAVADAHLCVFHLCSVIALLISFARLRAEFSAV